MRLDGGDYLGLCIQKGRLAKGIGNVLQTCAIGGFYRVGRCLPVPTPVLCQRVASGGAAPAMPIRVMQRAGAAGAAVSSV